MGFKLIGFRKSTRKHKKYDGILGDEKGNFIFVPFGSLNYEQFKDTTGLGLYSSKDHLDKDRQKAYKARHGGASHKSHTIRYTPAWFSWNFLWK